MKLVTAKQMQDVDRRTIDDGLMPSLQLMENAGQATAREAARMLQRVSGARVEIMCGKGNNGGDGFVVARELARRGADVRVRSTHAPEDLSPDARTQFERLSEANVEPARVLPSEDLEASLAGDLAAADLCVDALLGTGVEGALQGRLAALVDLLNRHARLVLAVDVPTGVDASTGAVLGTAVRAHCTVTFGLPKLGLVLHPGAEHAGRLVVADIGFPQHVVDAVDTPWLWFDAHAARACLPRLDPTAHKYARGTLLVIAGSHRYPGAASLTAEAAQRAGAGMVHLVSTESNRTILEARLPEVIFHGVPETPEGTCTAAAMEHIGPLLERADAVALGPGLGPVDGTLEWLRSFLAELELPAVIDADGLGAVPDAPHPAARVLTPHAGELARLLGRDAATVAAARADGAAELARSRGAVVLAKGAPTVVVEPGGTRRVNATGNVGLAKGGTGDVLTGIVGALLCQGLDAVDAASLGAYLHGAAADRLVAAGSPRSLVAGDLPDALAGVYGALEGHPILPLWHHST